MSNTREAGNGNEVRPGWQPWTCWEVVRFSREGEPAEWPQIRRGVRTKGVKSGNEACDLRKWTHGAGIACLITGKGNEIKLSSRKSDICYDVGATFRDSDQYDQATG